MPWVLSIGSGNHQSALVPTDRGPRSRTGFSAKASVLHLDRLFPFGCAPESPRMPEPSMRSTVGLLTRSVLEPLEPANLVCSDHPSALARRTVGRLPTSISRPVPITPSAPHERDRKEDLAAALTDRALGRLSISITGARPLASGALDQFSCHQCLLPMEREVLKTSGLCALDRSCTFQSS